MRSAIVALKLSMEASGLDRGVDCIRENLHLDVDIVIEDTCLAAYRARL